MYIYERYALLAAMIVVPVAALHLFFPRFLPSMGGAILDGVRDFFGELRRLPGLLVRSAGGLSGWLVGRFKSNPVATVAVALAGVSIFPIALFSGEIWILPVATVLAIILGALYAVYRARKSGRTYGSVVIVGAVILAVILVAFGVAMLLSNLGLTLQPFGRRYLIR